MAAVDGEVIEEDDLFDVRFRLYGGCGELRLKLGSRVRHLDGEQAFAVERGHCSTPDFREGHRDALDPERIKASMQVIDSGGATTVEPEPALRVERTGVSRAVPGFAVDFEFGFFVAVSAQVTFENVFTGDYDFTQGVGGELRCAKRRRRFRLPRLTKGIGKNREANFRRRSASEEAATCSHGGEVLGRDLVIIEMGDRLGLRGPVDRDDVCVRGEPAKRFQQTRENGRATGVDLTKRRQRSLTGLTMRNQAFEKSRGSGDASDCVAFDLSEETGGIDLARAAKIDFRNDGGDAGGEVGEDEDRKRREIDIPRVQLEARRESLVLREQKSMRANRSLR